MPTKPLLCNAKYCHFCGYGSGWEVFRASNMARHMETNHSTAEECIGAHYDPPTCRNQTWRVLDATHPELIVCIKKEDGNTVSAVYCLDCNHMEQLADEERGCPLLRFPSHVCPTTRGASKLKGTKRIKATEPAVGGAGTAKPSATRALLVPYDWLEGQHVDTEGDVLATLKEELAVAYDCRVYEKQNIEAKALVLDLRAQIADLKSAAPPAPPATVDLKTAATMVVDALCNDSAVGKSVQTEKAVLKAQIAEDMEVDPLDCEEYSDHRLLITIIKSIGPLRMATKRETQKVEAAEAATRARDGDLARLTVSNSQLIAEIGYRERDIAELSERVRVLEAAAQKEQTTPPPQ